MAGCRAVRTQRRAAASSPDRGEPANRDVHDGDDEEHIEGDQRREEEGEPTGCPVTAICAESAEYAP